MNDFSTLNSILWRGLISQMTNETQNVARYMIFPTRKI